MQNIKETLRGSGLTNRQINLYLSSLALGESGMTELAKKSKLKRTTAYLTFKTLEEKGLMGSFKMRSGLRFVATRPEHLVQRTHQQLQELEQIIPELKALTAKADEAPKISYYEGREGYLLAAEESLQNPNSIVRHIGSLAETHNILSLDYDIKTYVPGRLKNRIEMRALYFENEIPAQIRAVDPTELRETRFLPAGHRFNTSTLIYGNKVAIFSSKKELITVIIESEEIAAGERQKFDIIWDLIGRAK